MEKFLFGSGSSSWAIYTHRIYEHTTNETYMRRYILKHPWGSIRLHHILRSDDLRALHDHPFNFWTLLLYGGYTEYLPAKMNTTSTALIRVDRRMGSFRYVPATQAHRLVLTYPCWTLVFGGTSYRKWGFYLNGYRKADWVNWREYSETYGPEKSVDEVH